MLMAKKEECCPRFNPKPWEGKTVAWNGKLFAKAHIRCLFHIPLNFGSVMTDSMQRIEAAGALAEGKDFIALNDDCSLFRSDLYIAVTKPVPGMEMERISGTFLTKVFEGPFSDAGKWAKGMDAYVAKKGKKIKRLLFYYTTCPACAKKYGKNYTVLLAQV